MIRLLVDSSADYSKAELDEKHIEMVPLTITLNDSETYKDELEIARHDLYGMMAEGSCTVKTSQPSPQDFLEKFEAAKQAGDELICILLSSSLSGTVQSAVLARTMAGYDKIYIVDSLTATVAIKILADHALKMIAEQKTSAEIVNALESLKGRIKIKLVVDTLKFLYLGGRVSRTTAIVGDAVRVKPSIYVTQDGFVGVGPKYLGISRGVKDLTKLMQTTKTDPAFPNYLIYSYDTDNLNKLKKSLTDAGVSIADSYEIGATIGVHVGPGTFGVVYVE